MSDLRISPAGGGANNTGSWRRKPFGNTSRQGNDGSVGAQWWSPFCGARAKILAFSLIQHLTRAILILMMAPAAAMFVGIVAWIVFNDQVIR